MNYEVLATNKAGIIKHYKEYNKIASFALKMASNDETAKKVVLNNHILSTNTSVLTLSGDYCLYKDFVHLIDLLKECFRVDSIQMDVISTSVHNYKIDNVDFVYIPDMIIHKSKGWEITDESRNILTKIYNCKIERFF